MQDRQQIVIESGEAKLVDLTPEPGKIREQKPTKIEHKATERPAGYRYGAFIDWLEQFREDKTIFGQLRRFIERDACWPALSSISAYRQHLKQHFVAPVALEALRVAHRLYLKASAP